MGRMSRNKGKRGEREVIDILQPILDDVCSRKGVRRRALQRNTLQSDSGGHDIVGIPWLCLEIKRVETLSITQAWMQCVEQAQRVEGGIPVLLHRKNRGAWQCRMMGWLECTPGVQCVVDVSLMDFVMWFERVILERL